MISNSGSLFLSVSLVEGHRYATQGRGTMTGIDKIPGRGRGKKKTSSLNFTRWIRKSIMADQTPELSPRR